MRIRAATISAATLLWSVPLLAALTGDLRGSVLDPQGLAVAGASVTVRNVGTGIVRTVVTGSEGEFSLLQLDIGTYEVHVERQGFRTLSTSVAIRSGETTRIDIRLEVGPMTETIRVEAGAEALLDRSSPQASTSLEATTIQTLPIRAAPLVNRDPVTLVALAPGIVPVGANNPFLRAGSFSANGQRGRANNITIDNATATDITATGSLGTATISLDAIQELKVITNNFSAEFGRNAGSQVQIISRRGTNEYHGSVHWFHQNAVFNARDYFDTTGKATPLILNHWGFVAGGPILRDRLFIFGHYEGTKNRGRGSTTVATVLTPADAAGISDPTSAALFAAVGAPTAPTGQLSAAAPLAGDHYSWSLRVDQALRDGRDQITVRYGRDTITSADPSLTFLGTRLTNYGAQGTQTDDIVNLEHSHVFSPRVTNQLRFEFQRSTPSFAPFTTLEPPFAPVIMIAGFDAMGVSNVLPQGRAQNVFRPSDTLSWVAGRHALKFGVDAFRYQVNSFFDANFRGTFVFASLADFQNGVPQAYFQSVGNSTRHYRATDVFLFAQDDIRVTPTLTLNVGIRLESSGGASEKDGILANLDPASDEPLGGGGTGPLGSIVVGETAYDRNNNWAPRLGAAWNPRNGRLVLRGGYGWVYDFLFLNPVVNLAFSPPFLSSFSLFGSSISGDDSYANLVAGTAASQESARAAIGSFSPEQVNFGSLLPVQRDLRNPRSDQWSFGVEYQLSHDLVVKAGYVGNRAQFLQVSLPINLVRPENRPAPATTLEDETARFSEFFAAFSAENGTANGSVINNRLDPRFNSVTQLQSVGRSSYHGLQVELVKRFSRGFQVQGSYTYGRARDDVSDALNVLVNDSPQIQDPRNLRANHGPSQFDVTHRLVAHGLLEVPGTGRFRGLAARVLQGWAISGILTAQSGLPATILCGSRRGISDVALLGGGTVRANGDPRRFRPVPAGSAATEIPSPCERGVGLDPDGAPCRNTSGFPLTQPLLGNFGNSGRNRLRLDDLFNLDVGVFKNTRLSEAVTLQFRWETFNVLNHANFSGFVNTLTSSAFGTYTSTATDQRRMQFGLKILF